MGVAVAFIVLGIIFVIVSFLRGSGSGASSWGNASAGTMPAGFQQTFGGGYWAPFDNLVKNGTPAKGILIAVSPIGQRAGIQGRPFQTRAVTIDVEIPGQPPFTVNANPLIPLNLVGDVLPGATVELRLDRRNTSTMAIIGPGVGFAQQAVSVAS